MNKSKLKGDTFERSIVHIAQEAALKAYRNRMSRAPGDERWDVCIAGQYLECKKRKAGFKQILRWMEHNDGVIVSCDYHQPLVILTLHNYLKLLT